MLDLRGYFMAIHDDGVKVVGYSRVSRLCDHQTSDDRISEKLLSNGPPSLRPNVLPKNVTTDVRGGKKGQQFLGSKIGV